MGRSAVVVGFGVTGQAVARALVEAGDDVVVIEDQPADTARQVADGIGVRLVSVDDPAELAGLIGGASMVVPSPGVPVSHPVYKAAAEALVPVVSEIELAWRRLQRKGSAAPELVAITGTNGKTTVTTLVTAMLHASGRRAVAAGNIGLPLIDAVEQPTEVIVGEVSSFQLQFTEGFRPAVSCWLNVAEDHLDWHPTMDHYTAAKERIWAAQQAGDVAVFNADDARVVAAAVHIPEGVHRTTFSIQGPADFAFDSVRSELLGPDGGVIAPVDGLPRRLPHDLANDLAAAAVAVAAGATVAGCREALQRFAGLPHRVELIGQADGVSWYDDSKATTPASVLAAVAGFDSVVLIAGGRNKGLDLGSLSRSVPPVRAVVAIGEAAGEIEAAFSGLVPVEVATSMSAAVKAAEGVARPGDAVLLSPGCASFDWYRSYGQRGDQFATLVRDRTGGSTVESGLGPDSGSR
jgi:UDP-N-acetylmuramoylalanine--D-glutamate ligase